MQGPGVYASSVASQPAQTMQGPGVYAASGASQPAQTMQGPGVYASDAMAASVASHSGNNHKKRQREKRPAISKDDIRRDEGRRDHGQSQREEPERKSNNDDKKMPRAPDPQENRSEATGHEREREGRSPHTGMRPRAALEATARDGNPDGGPHDPPRPPWEKPQPPIPYINSAVEAAPGRFNKELKDRSGIPV